MQQGENGVKRWKARAVLGAERVTGLTIARNLGQTVIVEMNGERLEITIACIASNSVALLLETSSKNLILRKELDDC
jgi:sRNA-binding carbon storage regulator CsrA